MTTHLPAEAKAAPRVGRPRVPTALQFVLLALVWGSSFLFIKVGLEGMSAGQVVLGRLLAGAATLLVICVASRQPLPRDRAVWGHLFVVGLLLCVVPFLLFTWAEGRISSGLASIYNATTPLMTTAVVMVALPSEPRTRGRLVGLLLGFVGVVVILSPWNGLGQADVGGQLACLGATACYGLGFTYLRRAISPLGLPTVTVAFGQVALAALVMLVAAPFAARRPVHPTWPVVLSVLALGALGTGLAYVWNTNIVADWGASNASTVTYLTPVVGVVPGVLVLGEHLTWSEPLGALLVVLGILASQGRLKGLFGGRAEKR